MHNLKEKLKRNEVTIGSWLSLGNPAMAEIMVDAGFEWLVIDLEHSAITIREAEELIRIIELKNTIPLVRVTSNDAGQIKRVMDAGAQGVIVPMVKTQSEAEEAVRAVRYPPMGTRGVGLARAQRYGPGFDAYSKHINETAIVIAQIEHIEAIRNIDQILSVEGINGSIIGPYDLSASMGKPGRYDDPDVRVQLEQYETTSRRIGKPMGYHVINVEYKLVKAQVERGYSFVAFSADFLFLGHCCREQMRMLKNSISV